jgi:hypothetical protein
MIDLNEDPPTDSEAAEPPAAVKAASEAPFEASSGAEAPAEANPSTVPERIAGEPAVDVIATDGQQADAADKDEEAREKPAVQTTQLAVGDVADVPLH